jgi:hypothetical protein
MIGYPISHESVAKMTNGTEAGRRTRKTGTINANAAIVKAAVPRRFLKNVSIMCSNL